MQSVAMEIVNPRTGQQMRFLTIDQNALRIETLNPPGPAEPEHVHPHQKSSFEVLSGTLHVAVRGETTIIRAGEHVVIAANTPHSFWNEGPEAATAIQEFRPALRTEAFFRTYFALARDGRTDARGIPSPLQLAVLVPAFRNEIRLTRPPWMVVRLLALLLGPLARARGYHAIHS